MKQFKIIGNLVLGLLLMVVWPGLYMKAGNMVVMLYSEAHLAFFTMAVVGLSFIILAFYQIYTIYFKSKVASVQV